MGKQYKKQRRNMTGKHGPHKAAPVGKNKDKETRVYRGAKRAQRGLGIRGSRRGRGEGTRERRENEVPIARPINALTNVPLIVIARFPPLLFHRQRDEDRATCCFFGWVAVCTIGLVLTVWMNKNNSP